MQIVIDIKPGHQSYLLAYKLSDIAGDYSKLAYERYCETGEKDTDPIWVQFTEDAKWFWALSKIVGKVKCETEITSPG
jgi:hypothetical protein